MTMDQLYLPITVVLAIATVIRVPSAIRHPEARAAWLGTALAVPALLSRGAIIPIQPLDAWMGGQNIIFLVQCWYATFAFWAIAEAAGQRPGERQRLQVGVPFVWSVLYTIPFFLIEERSPTELFFIDAHVNDPAAIVCGVLYMVGIIAICGRLIIRLSGRRAVPHWLLRAGGVLVISGSVLWSLAIVIHHIKHLQRESILWMYLGFDVLFYPGVVLLAMGLIAFAVQRRARESGARRRIHAVEGIMRDHSYEFVSRGGGLPYQLFDLLVQLRDGQVLGLIVTTPQEDHQLRDVADWLRRVFPQVSAIDHRINTAQ